MTPQDSLNIAELYRNYYKHYFGNYSNAPTREMFDIHADRYAWNFDRWLRDAPRDALILEIGCGVGQFLHYLRRGGFSNVIGFDLSEEQIEQARIFFEKDESETPAPALSTDDALEYLAQSDQRPDFIIMNDVIEHIPTDQTIPLLASCRESLAPGGALLLKTPNMDNPAALTLRYRDFTHTTGFTHTSLEFALRMAGFDAVEILGEEAPIKTWKQQVRRRVLRGVCERLMRLTYYAMEMTPIPPVLSQWLLVRASCVDGGEGAAS